MSRRCTVDVPIRELMPDGTFIWLRGTDRQRAIAHDYALWLRRWYPREKSKFKPDERQPQARPRPARPLAPAAPQAPERLVVPLYVTREEGSGRDWEEVYRLVDRVNAILSPSRVALEVVEPGECSEIPEPRGFCPFREELDHATDFLHLACVRELPGDRLVRPSCGRCCLVSDRSDDRSVAREVALLLGLTPVRDVSITDRLLSAGSGLELSLAERQWLRWHASALLGRPLPSHVLKLPVWVYAAPGTHRTEPAVRQILEKVNVVWEQAGIELELTNWCRLQPEEYHPTLARMASLTTYGPRAVHLFVAPHENLQLQSDAAHRLLLLPDGLQGSRTWALARALGLLLRLEPVAGEDQLMGPADTGFRLHAQEVMEARWAARLQLERQVVPPPFPTVSAPAPSPLQRVTAPVRVHLVRSSPQACTLTVEETLDLLGEVASLWSQVGIGLEIQSVSECTPSPAALAAAWPSSAASAADRRPGWLGLAEARDYDPRALNLFLVSRVLQDASDVQGAYNGWHSAGVLLTSQDYPQIAPAHFIAISLAVFWGLRIDPQGPPERLLTWKTPGTLLTPAEGEVVRTFLRRSEAHPPEGLELLTIPVRLQLVDCPFTPAQAIAMLGETNLVWAAAGIRLNPVGAAAVEFTAEALRAALPTDPQASEGHRLSGQLLTEAESYDEAALNLVWTRQLTYHNGRQSAHFSSCHRSERVLVAPADYYAQSPGRTVARALGVFLGLTFGMDVPPDRLTSYASQTGTAFSEDEIKQARRQAQRLASALSGYAFLEDLEDLVYPVRLWAVSRSLDEARALAAEAELVWAEASVRLQIECREADLAPGALEAALPGSPGRSFEGLARPSDCVSVYLLDRLPAAAGQKEHGCSAIPPERLILLGREKLFSQGKNLARSLALVLGLEANWFQAATHLLGWGEGTLFTGSDLRRARAEIARLFPAKELVPLKLRLLLVRNARYGTTITPEQVPELAGAARAAGFRLDVQSCEVREVSDGALEEAFPNPPGTLIMRMPMCFGLMTVAGLNPPGTLTAFLVREVPHAPGSSFGAPGLLLAGERQFGEALRTRGG